MHTKAEVQLQHVNAFTLYLIPPLNAHKKDGPAVHAAIYFYA